MKKQKSRHQMDGLLMLLLFGVFAVCVLAVLLTGAKAYRGLTDRDRAAYDRRTCVQYLATRVRQGDTEGGMTVKPFGNTTALCIEQYGFVTWVYCYDGYLMELYCFEDAELEPQDGQKIMPMERLSATLEDGLMRLEIGSAGDVVDVLCLSLRSGEGVRG